MSIGTSNNLIQWYWESNGHTHRCGGFFWMSSESPLLNAKPKSNHQLLQIEVAPTTITTQTAIEVRVSQRQPGSQDVKERVMQYLSSTPLASISSAVRTFGMEVSTATTIVRGMKKGAHPRRVQ